MEDVSAKQLLIDFLNQLPENLTLGELMYKLNFEENLMFARKDIREGQRIFSRTSRGNNAKMVTVIWSNRAHHSLDECADF